MKHNLFLIFTLVVFAISGCVESIDEAALKESLPKSIREYPVKYISVNDIDIGYREFGAGKPIVIITPFATEMDMYNMVFIEQLSSNYRVIIFDNRGMGYSSSNEESISIPLLASDTAELIDALELGSVHVFGSSMGSVIAQELVLEHPEKIDCVILSSATYSLDIPESMALKNILQSRASDPQTKPIIRQYAQGNLKWNGTYERIPEIKNKILILTGKDDILTPPSISIEFAEMASDATLVQFESVGHAGEQEIPEEYANEILSFLALNNEST